jgi:long-subunit fatty acid transport protein
MKKFLVVLGVCLFAFAFVAGDLLAYQEAFNIAGHRTQSRNAASGTIDAAYYNPAGLVALKEGLYVDLGNRILSLTTNSEIPAAGLESESSTITYLLPNLALVYKTGSGALFGTMDIREGGAGGVWDDPESLTLVGTIIGGVNPALGGNIAASDKLEMSTYTFGYTLGGAFAVNDMVKFAGGLRYFRKISDAETTGAPAIAGGDLTFHSSLDGYGGFVGLMVSPITELNVSVQYQGKVMKYGRDDLSGNEPSISPSILLLGVSYKVLPELEVMFSYNREFTAEQEKPAGVFWFDEKNKDKQVFGLGAEYRVNDMILASAGASYKMTATADENNSNPLDPGFNELDLGLGAVITVMPGLNVEVGAAYNIYQEAENDGVPTVIKHNRDAWVVGFGVNYKIL